MVASSKITTRLAARSAAAVATTRSFTASAPKHMKVVCALYEGGEAGQQNPNIFGCVENELGLRQFLEDRGHEFVVTSDKDGDHSEFARQLHDADVVISQPFWPAYITRERIAMAPKLKLAITAGIGSDHVDLAAACDRNITVAEVTGSNVVSVAEHVVMMILSLVRNYMPAYKQVRSRSASSPAVALPPSLTLSSLLLSLLVL
jgi:formate dehydrogenase